MDRKDKTPILDVIRSQMIADDATDYRAMLVRERVRAETGVNHTFRAVDSARRIGLLDSKCL